MRVVIADTASFPAPPPTFVSDNVMDVTRCDGPRSRALDPALTEAEGAAVTREGGLYADFTKYVCGADRCPVIVHDLLVYRDENHLTTEFVRYLATGLDEQIRSGL
ncbi:hypothetical protein GCM10022383_02840 [Microbacterium soli]|uniref:SGNH domain-containing protein n=2 Tax=Microbacterium soli TaxID=446075 RepID=A0ABP7MP49_9MICO